MKAGSGSRWWMRSLLALALLNGIVATVHTLPQWFEQRRIDEVLTATRARIAMQRKSAEAWGDWYFTLVDNTRDAARLHDEVLLPRRKALPYLQERVYKLARESGLQPRQRSWERKDVAGVPQLRRLTTTMPLAGSYQQLIDFLECVESGKDFIVVDQLRISKAAGGSSELSVTLSAYYRGDGEAPKP